MSVATIGSALAEKRTELGLDKGEAAERVGMSRTSYSSYERDAQRPSVDVFPALANFLNVSIEELLTLYGATCVAAARASLSRAVVDLPVETANGPGESVVSRDAPVPEETTAEAPTEPEPVTVVATPVTEETPELVQEARPIHSEETSPWEEPSAPFTPDLEATTSASSDDVASEGSTPADDETELDDLERAVSSKKKKKKKKKKK